MGRWDPGLSLSAARYALLRLEEGPPHQELAVSHPGLAGTVGVFRRPCERESPRCWLPS